MTKCKGCNRNFPVAMLNKRQRCLFCVPVKDNLSGKGEIIRCPICKSYDITAHPSTDIDAGIITQQVTCLACRARFLETWVPSKWEQVGPALPMD